VVFDLTVAVEVGLILACVFFIYRMSTLFRVELDATSPAGVRVHHLYGSLFFGAVAKVEAVGEALPAGTRAVVLEMHRLVLMDSTGLDAVQQLHRTLKRQGVRLLLCDLNEQPLLLIRQAEFDALLGQGNLLPDLPTALSTAQAATPAEPAAAAGTGSFVTAAR
jgi:sulfate permease, SulP family